MTTNGEASGAPGTLQERLQVLHAVGNQLVLVDSVDALCRLAVELGRARLGFERISIWFADGPAHARGSYGIDEQGAVRDEQHARVRVSGASPMGRILHGDETLLLETEGPLLDHAARPVGQGMHALAPLWDGWQVLGAVSIDNHLTGRPLTDTDCELLHLYAAIIGHLYLEKSSAARLNVTQTAVDFLADGVYQIDATGRFRYVNAAACAALRYPREELLTLGVPDIDPEFHVARWQQHWTALGEDSQKVFETTHLRKDGTTYPVEIRVVHFPFQGQVQHFAFSRDITERKQVEAQLRDAADKLREMAQRVVAGEEQERQRLSRELHDQVGQNLAVLNLTLGQAQDILAPEHAGARALLDDAQHQVQELREHLQHVMYDLRPPMLDDLGIYQALQWYAGRLSARHDLTITVRRRGPARRWPAPVETALFRIAQEALTNVVLHARATVVMVTLTQTANAIELEIKDNGLGFRRRPARRTPPRGLGIAIMEERALAVGGAVTVDSAPGRGTRISVRIPRKGRDQ